MTTATVKRLPAPSGNRDNDHFQARCLKCGWTAVAMHSNRTIEGRSLAERDAREHRCSVSPAVATLVEDIRRHYGVFGGRDGFLTDPGGWIDYCGLTDDDDIALAAINLIRAES